jgi:hypothetical protein
MAVKELNPQVKHPCYVSVLPDIQMCRDLDAGEPAVKKGERRERYLPRLAGHKAALLSGRAFNDDPYDEYVSRAYFFGAFGRTVDALAGLVNRLDPTVEAPPGLDPIREDVDGQGTTLTEFAAKIVKELVKVGRVGLLSDWPSYDDKKRTKEQAASDFRRPYVTLYLAEDILNWRTRRVGAKLKLSLVVLDERINELDPGDELQLEEVSIQQVRILDLDPAGDYRMRTFQLRKNTRGRARWVLASTVYPSQTGSVGEPVKMREIQFDFINAEDCHPDLKRPPMTDLAYTVVAFLKNSADYENALHLMGFPQLIIPGYDETQENGSDPTDGPKKVAKQRKVWRIGDGNAWEFKGDVKPFYLSLESDLEELREAMKSKRDDMVALGARMLARDKLAAEAARTEELRRQPENSALATIAQSASRGLTSMLQRLANWQKISGKIKVQLNTNFFDTTMSASDLVAFISAVQEGAFAMSDLRWLMRQGNLLRHERTDAEIDAEVDAQAIPLSAFEVEDDEEKVEEPDEPNEEDLEEEEEPPPAPKRKKKGEKPPRPPAQSRKRKENKASPE